MDLMELGFAQLVPLQGNLRVGFDSRLPNNCPCMDITGLGFA